MSTMHACYTALPIVHEEIGTKNPTIPESTVSMLIPLLA